MKAAAKLEARTATLVRDLIADYIEKRLHHLANSTVRTYGRQLKLIEAALGTRPIKDVTPQEIVDLIAKRKAGWRDQTDGWRETETLYIVARELFKFAAGQRLIVVNPTMGISLEAVIGTRPPPVKKRLMLTEDEIREVMNAKMNRQNQLSI
nr:site-specific integrase [Bordetella trematum]